MIFKSGIELQEYISEETSANWEKRDFLSVLSQYYASSRRRVLGISGLRGTGKTVGILQSLVGQDALYLCPQTGDTETAQDYIEILKKAPQKIIAIDEYTWIPDKSGLDAYLYTLVQNGKRVVVTGTESIAIEYLRYSQLIHRIDIYNVNHFSYDEFCRMNHAEKNKTTCEMFLRTSGVFKEYVIDSFKTMRKYIELAIIDNLSSTVDYLDKSYVAAVVYTILHKAVCDATEKSVPQIIENGISTEDFLEDVGVDSAVIIERKDFDEVSSILRRAGIIVTVPNYKVKSEYRTYITNPALTYQMIQATHKLENVSEAFYQSLFGYMYEASCVVHAAYNLINDSFSQDTLYYLNKRRGGRQSEIDFLIVGEPQKKHAYLFECKLNDGPVVKTNSSLVTDVTENILPDCDIRGRYVVYNGPRNYDKVNGREILYVGMDSILSNYHSFSANKATILEEIKRDGRVSYFEEKSKNENGTDKYTQNSIQYSAPSGDTQDRADTR